MTKINDLAMGIIRESAIVDKVDSASAALMSNEIKDILESADEVTLSKMNVQMVRVLEQDDNYYIELDELHKFCESTGLDSISALNAIADYYNETCVCQLSSNNFFVTIESTDTYNNLSRLASDGDLTAASVLESTIREIKHLRENGVTIKKIQK